MFSGENKTEFLFKFKTKFMLSRWMISSPPLQGLDEPQTSFSLTIPASGGPACLRSTPKC